MISKEVENPQAFQRHTYDNHLRLFGSEPGHWNVANDKRSQEGCAERKFG